MIRRELMKMSRTVLPEWQCPTCGVGTVRDIGDSGRLEVETHRSAFLASVGAEASYEARFTAYLQCRVSDCEEIVVVSGTKTQSVTEDYYGGPVTSDTTYDIEYVSPSPSVVEIPERTPPDVAACLKEAARLYWIDVGASANKLRMAIEVILDEQAIRTEDTALGARLGRGPIQHIATIGRFHLALGPLDGDDHARSVLAVGRCVGEVGAAPAQEPTRQAAG